MELNDSGGATRIERRLGFTSIAVQPTSEAVVARVRSFGFLDAPLGFTAGYAARRAVSHRIRHDHGND